MPNSKMRALSTGYFHRIVLFGISVFGDCMRFKNEKDFEDALMKWNYENDQCFFEKCYKAEYIRQFALPQYGVIDIMSIEYNFDGVVPVVKIVIIELKNVPISLNDVAQICRYRNGLVKYIKRTLGHRGKRINISICGLLIGEKSRHESEIGHVSENIEWLDVCVYRMNLDGFVRRIVAYPGKSLDQGKLNNKLVKSIFGQFFEEWRMSLVYKEEGSGKSE